MWACSEVFFGSVILFLLDQIRIRLPERIVFIIVITSSKIKGLLRQTPFCRLRGEREEGSRRAGGTRNRRKRRRLVCNWDRLAHSSRTTGSNGFGQVTMGAGMRYREAGGERAAISPANNTAAAHPGHGQQQTLLPHTGPFRFKEPFHGKAAASTHDALPGVPSLRSGSRAESTKKIPGSLCANDPGMPWLILVSAPSLRSAESDCHASGRYSDFRFTLPPRLPNLKVSD